MLEGILRLIQMNLMFFSIGALVLFGLLFYSWKVFSSVKTSKKYDRVTGQRFRTVVSEQDPLLATNKDKMEGFISQILPTVKATQRKLSRAGVKIPTSIYLIILVSMSGLLSLFVSIPSVPGFALPIVYFIAVHFFTDLVILRILRWRHQAKMFKQMPEAIDYIIRGIVSGQSLEASIREATKAIEAPLGEELSMIPRLTDIGLSLQEAMSVTANEIDMAEFDFFVAACIVQLESGGNLAEVLVGLSDMIRGRQALHSKIAAMSSEGKIGAIVLSCLPVGIFFYLYFGRPDYLTPLFTSDLGQLILFGAAGLLVVGTGLSLYMSRIKV